MDMKQLTKIILAWELAEEEIPRVHIAEQLEIGRATLYRWLDGIEKAGSLTCFLDEYIQAKKGERTKRKVDTLLKHHIWNIREEKRECCGQKIQYFLKKEYDIDLGVTAIYQILKEKYHIKSKWKKNKTRGPVPKAFHAREVVQMDTIDFGDIFAFTSVDIFSKEADIFLAPDLTSVSGYQFLKYCMNRRFNSFVELIQTDGGPEFKDMFKQHVLEYTNRHRIARPYKKNEQSYIESFNRSVRKECLGWSKYKTSELPILTKEVEEYLLYYHKTRPHIGLGMRPPLDH